MGGRRRGGEGWGDGGSGVMGEEGRGDGRVGERRGGGMGGEEGRGEERMVFSPVGNLLELDRQTGKGMARAR